jgi:tRNA (adenine22-N1)-methyltransferase
MNQTKINKRAKYSQIWDCCCDHGLLGQSLLQLPVLAQEKSKIHFVDIVPKLISDLCKQLESKQPEKNQQNLWQTHCIDSAEIPIAQFSDSKNDRHLVIIAGVGGELCIELVERIHAQNPNQTIDYLLCPIHQLYQVRKSLRTLGFSLLHEELVEENKRYYELLLVSQTASGCESGQTISPAGDDIWLSQAAPAYLDKTLSHYLRIQQGQDSTELQCIIQEYQLIKARFI